MNELETLLQQMKSKQEEYQKKKIEYGEALAQYQQSQQRITAFLSDKEVRLSSGKDVYLYCPSICGENDDKLAFGDWDGSEGRRYIELSAIVEVFSEEE